MHPYEVIVDTFARTWRRTFFDQNQAVTYFHRQKPTVRFSAELRHRGNVLLSTGH